MTGELSVDRERFAEICRELCTAPQGRYADENSIGVLGEKRLHAIIKRFICPDTAFHELLPPLSPSADAAESVKRKKYVADILCGDEIYEIQTGSLYPLRDKLRWYADNTDCHITIVHPIAAKKRNIWIDPATGESRPSRSLCPAKRPCDILPELKYVAPLAASGRVTVLLLMLEAEEYRFLDGFGNGGKRGSSRFELLPISLMDEVLLQMPEDYFALLPKALPSTAFTAAEFAHLMRFRSRPAYTAIHALEALGVLSACGKRGRAALYSSPFDT